MPVMLPSGFRYIEGRLFARTKAGWRPATKYERNRVAALQAAHEAGDLELARWARANLVSKLNRKLDAER